MTYWFSISIFALHYLSRCCFYPDFYLLHCPKILSSLIVLIFSTLHFLKSLLLSSLNFGKCFSRLFATSRNNRSNMDFLNFLVLRVKLWLVVYISYLHLNSTVIYLSFSTLNRRFSFWTLALMLLFWKILNWLLLGLILSIKFSEYHIWGLLLLV